MSKIDADMPYKVVLEYYYDDNNHRYVMVVRKQRSRNKEVFMAPNGVSIRTDDYFDWAADPNKLWLLGNNHEKDNAFVIIKDINTMTKIATAVAAFNGRKNVVKIISIDGKTQVIY
jgi:hypothetical protein